MLDRFRKRTDAVIGASSGDEDADAESFHDWTFEIIEPSPNLYGVRASYRGGPSEVLQARSVIREDVVAMAKRELQARAAADARLAALHKADRLVGRAWANGFASLSMADRIDMLLAQTRRFVDADPLNREYAIWIEYLHVLKQNLSAPQDVRRRHADGLFRSMMDDSAFEATGLGQEILKLLNVYDAPEPDGSA